MQGQGAERLSLIHIYEDEDSGDDDLEEIEDLEDMERSLAARLAREAREAELEDSLTAVSYTHLSGRYNARPACSSIAQNPSENNRMVKREKI